MSKTPNKKETIATVRCAVYTRKSTEEGLEQEFNTLDAQRESAEAYIASQKSEGWQCLPDRYDDGGFSGGNMDRPALDRLLADIKAGKVDCVVVYKVDRLSRSLLDWGSRTNIGVRHSGRRRRRWPRASRRASDCRARQCAAKSIFGRPGRP